jgi:hypothetical protein
LALLIAVPNAMAAFSETVISQSFSWMLKPTGELVLPAVASFR